MAKSPSFIETLAWLQEMGYDEPLCEFPQNKLQAPVARQEPAPASETLEALKAKVQSFPCALRETAISTVFSDGNPKARVMVIGEAPGAEEDQQGIPFVGQSGQLLMKAFEAVGLSRVQDLYITNIIAWRPPGNRTPTPAEIALCLPLVRQHIALINPDFIVCVGAVATAAILGTTNGISKLRGKWQAYPLAGKQAQVLPVYHPAFLLRSPSRKKEMWFDFLALKAKL